MLEKRKQLLYVEVHDQIKNYIKDKGLMPGDRLPSEHELISHFGVSRGTLRQALMLLRESGVIYNHQGKGTFLRPANKCIDGLEKARCDLTQFCTVPITSKELTVHYIPGTGTFKEYFEHVSATLLAKFQILYFSDSDAVAYRDIFVPYKKLEESNTDLSDNAALMDFIDDLIQKHIFASESTIDYVEARENIATVMKASPETYLLCISEILRDKTNTVIAFSKFFAYPEFFKISVNRHY